MGPASLGKVEAQHVATLGTSLALNKREAKAKQSCSAFESWLD